MPIVRAFLLGAAATGVLAYVCAAALALAAASGGASVTLAVGPLLFVSVAQHDGGAGVGLGTGLLVVALVGGLLNGAAATAMHRRRAGRDRDRVP